MATVSPATMAAAVAMVTSSPSSSSCASSPASSSSLYRHRSLMFASSKRPQRRCLLPLSTPHRRSHCCIAAAATTEETTSAAAGASADSVVAQVAALEEEPDTLGVAPPSTKARKPSPLERGGTLAGDQAAGKDPGLSALGKSAARVAATAGPFQDARWTKGTWDLQQFMRDGKVDWDAVIDAEVIRRKWLEENPEASRNDDPVVFETSVVPWWAWVKRFHLPEAELLNGRAAMIGFFMGYVVDSLTGAGLVDQTSSFLGKLLLFISVVGVLFIRKNEDVENLKQLVKEWNFYDRQWQATWQDEQISGPESKE